MSWLETLLDLKMFEFTRWTFEEGSQGGANDDEEEHYNRRSPGLRPVLSMRLTVAISPRILR